MFSPLPALILMFSFPCFHPYERRKFEFRKVSWVKATTKLNHIDIIAVTEVQAQNSDLHLMISAKDCQSPNLIHVSRLGDCDEIIWISTKPKCLPRPYTVTTATVCAWFITLIAPLCFCFYQAWLICFVRKIDILCAWLISDIANSSSSFLGGTETKKNNCSIWFNRCTFSDSVFQLWFMEKKLSTSFTFTTLNSLFPYWYWLISP